MVRAFVATKRQAHTSQKTGVFYMVVLPYTYSLMLNNLWTFMEKTELTAISISVHEWTRSEPKQIITSPNNYSENND